MKTACPVCRAPITMRSKWTEAPIGFQEMYLCGALYWWGEEAHVQVRCPERNRIREDGTTAAESTTPQEAP